MDLQRLYSDDQSRIEAYAESLTGGRLENQDSYGWKDTHRGYLVTVCDGMGGGPGGKTASSIAVKAIIAGIEEGEDDEDIVSTIKNAVCRANRAIYEAGVSQPSLKGMGSTATLLLVSEKSAYIAHVGDSRVYQLRGKKKVFRTFDHSVVFEMVQKGFLTEEQARLSTQSNVITRALGISPEVVVDISEVPYKKGDRFLLCTDGIHGTMPEKELLGLITNKSKPLKDITHDVATLVDELGKHSGNEHDNLTLAVVEMKSNPATKSSGWKMKNILLAVLTLLLCISVAFNIIQYKPVRSIQKNNKGKEVSQQSVEEKENTTNVTNGDSIKDND